MIPRQGPRQRLAEFTLLTKVHPPKKQVRHLRASTVRSIGSPPARRGSWQVSRRYRWPQRIGLCGHVRLSEDGGSHDRTVSC
jgi:hypothetical protein